MTQSCTLCGGKGFIISYERPGPPETRDCQCQWKNDSLFIWDSQTRDQLAIDCTYNLEDSLKEWPTHLSNWAPGKHGRYVIHSQSAIVRNTVASLIIKRRVECATEPETFKIISTSTLKRMLNKAYGFVNDQPYEEREAAEDAIDHLIKKSVVLVIGDFEIPTKPKELGDLSEFIRRRGAQDLLTIITTEHDLTHTSLKEEFQRYREIRL